MQNAIGTMDPYSSARGTGNLGRMVDVLSSMGYKTAAFSVDTTLVALAGSDFKISRVSIPSSSGFQQFNVAAESDSENKAIQKLNEGGGPQSSLYSQTWSDFFVSTTVIIAD